MARPKGSLKTPGSGRKKGTKNKNTRDNLVEIERLKATGETPLEFLLAVMRDPSERADRRLHAAGIAANYCHPKLSSVETTGPGGGPVAIHVFAGFKYDDDPDDASSS